MIDVKATNLKLKQRARNILRFVGGDACTQSDLELDEILESCRGGVKLAAVTIVLKVSVAEAEERLQRNKGVLARVFEEARKEKEAFIQTENQSADDGNNGLVLCVDAGGTSCKAVVMSIDGEMGIGAAGPCNVYVFPETILTSAFSSLLDYPRTNFGIDAAISTISKAVQDALDNCKPTKGRQFGSVKFSAVWVGMAGYGRPSLSRAINNALSELFNLRVGTKLRITIDIDILPSSLTSQADVDSIIVLVAGTGSIATSYAKTKEGEFQRTSRVGGWGYLLGDDGSGYGIGREALRTALRSSDFHRLRQISSTGTKTGEEQMPKLTQAINQHFQNLYPDAKLEDLLSTILVPDPAAHKTEDATLATTKRIAGVAKVVLSLASEEDDEGAKRIVDAGVASLVDLVALLVSGTDPARSGLVLAGGMMKDDFYRATLLKALEARCGAFKQVETVDQPAVVGARYLLGRI
jgi:N-acetylmuramic acid 6-phosphate etherase